MSLPALQKSSPSVPSPGGGMSQVACEGVGAPGAASAGVRVIILDSAMRIVLAVAAILAILTVSTALGTDSGPDSKDRATIGADGKGLTFEVTYTAGVRSARVYVMLGADRSSVEPRFG